MNLDCCSRRLVALYDLFVQFLSLYLSECAWDCASKVSHWLEHIKAYLAYAVVKKYDAQVAELRNFILSVVGEFPDLLRRLPCVLKRRKNFAVLGTNKSGCGFEVSSSSLSL